jgi:hypothetical protein
MSSYNDFSLYQMFLFTLNIFSLLFFLYLSLFFLIKVEDMIKEVDVDGDGKIDFDEFVYALVEPEDSQDEDQSDDESYESPEQTPL